MAISYGLLERQLERAAESLTQPELPAELRSLHAARVAGPAEVFRAAQRGLVAAEDAASKERREVKDALAALDRPYRFVRALVAGHLPDVGLPETLPAAHTDTDRKLAIEALLLRIESNAGQPWADELAKTEFATKGPGVVKEINEDSAARASLSKAIETRAAAFGVAYEAMVTYRGAVRAGVGSTSPIYRRLTSSDRRAAVEPGTPGTPTPTA